ncbi:hypothetical protein SMY33_003705 [Cronobacter malonaticus]|nr:hypothetical protein [Cronobacter malonaticus]
MSEISKYRDPAAFRVDPAEGPSWLTFRCEEDLRESGLITDGDKVVALIELLALRERAEPVEHEAHIRLEVNAGGNTWIQCSKQAFEREKARGALCRVLYESPPAPVLPEGLRIALSNAGIAAPESDEMLWASQQDYIQMLVTWVKDRKPFKHAPVVPDEVLKSLDLLFRRSYFRRWVKDPQGYVAGSIPVRDLVNVALFAEACRAAMLATPSGKKE